MPKPRSRRATPRQARQGARRKKRERQMYDILESLTGTRTQTAKSTGAPKPRRRPRQRSVRSGR
jgi:hypothetical protein